MSNDAPKAPSSKRHRFGQLAGDGAKLGTLLSPDAAADMGTMEPIALDLIDLDPNNVRKLKLDKSDPRNIPTDHPDAEVMRQELESLQELASSIEVHGLNQAVGIYRVGTRFRLVWGERRYLAHRLLGREHIKANILRQPPTSTVATQLAENMFRSDLNLAERVLAFDRLIAESQSTEKPINSIRELAAATGLAFATASRYLSIQRAHPDVRQAIAAGLITKSKHALQLTKVENPEERRAIIDALAAGQEPVLPQVSEKPETPTNSTPPQPVGPPPKRPVRPRGNPRKFVKLTLKSPLSGSVVKTLVDKVLPKQEAAVFAKVDWNDITSVQSVLEQLIHRIVRDLEQSQGKSPKS